MAPNQESKYVGEKFFPQKLILWMLRRCDRSVNVKVGFYQIAMYTVWSFNGRMIATGVFPMDMFNASVKIVGFGKYKDTEIKGPCAKEYEQLGNEVK